MAFTCLQPVQGRPFLCCSHSKEPDPETGLFPKDDEILAWACVLSQIMYRCQHCKSPRIRPSKVLATRKNGTKWWICGECGKNSSSDDIQKDAVIILDLAWVASLDKHRGKGYAREVLEYLKNNCHRLNTQISASTEASIELCKSVGMIERGPILSWHKEGYEYAKSKADPGDVQQDDKHSPPAS